MFCVACGHQLVAGAAFCTRCGARVNPNPAPAPAFALAPPATYSHALAPWRFYLLMVATMGLYLYYWCYRNWTYLRDHVDPTIRPGLRTLGLMLVPILNIVLLFRQFDDIATETKATYSPGWLTVRWLVVGGLSNVAAQYGGVLATAALGSTTGPLVGFAARLAFCAGAALVLSPVQVALNAWWPRVQPELPARDAFTGWQLFWVIAGGCLWLISLLGTLATTIGALSGK